MDTGTFRGIITLLVMIAFLGITWWAYSKRRKRDFDEAAHLPFADDDELPRQTTHAPQDEPDTRPADGSHKDASRKDDSRKDKGDENT